MAKIKGKNLSLMLDTQELNLDTTSIVLQNEEVDGEAVTFAELANGSAVQWYFEVTGVSDFGDGTFWSYCWDNPGVATPFVFKPYGNTAPSITQPHFTGTCSVVAKPPIGGAADEVWTFEARLDVDGEPQRVTV